MTISDLKNRATITAPEAADLLNISTQAAYRALRNGHLPSVRLGRKVVVPTKPLLELLGHSDEQVSA